MFQAFDHLNRAVRILIGRNAMLNERLYEAAREFSLALQRPEQWPNDLLENARIIEKKLTARGRIDATVNGMDVSVADEIAQELYALAVAASTTQVRRSLRRHVPFASSKGRDRRRLDINRASH